MKVWDHHKPLILELAPLKGFYIPDASLNELLSPKDRYLTKILNKGYRNMAYFINGQITGTDQTLIDGGGGTRTLRANKYIAGTSTEYYHSMFQLSLAFGSSTNPHDVNRYQLYSPHSGIGGGGFGWLVEEDNQTRIRSYHRYAFPPPSRVIGEAGFFIIFRNYYFMLARAIIDPPITKNHSTIYEDGWEIIFPANYTRWFLRFLMETYPNMTTGSGIPIIDVNGVSYIMRQDYPGAGSTDLMIGSDNSSPSPTDYHVKSPIGSLSNQSHSVEIDTTLQECRITRTGQITPASNITLGEVAIYCNVYDTSGTARKIMIARGIWDPALTLEQGVTYTIGISLKMG